MLVIGEEDLVNIVQVYFMGKFSLILYIWTCVALSSAPIPPFCIICMLRRLVDDIFIP